VVETDRKRFVALVAAGALAAGCGGAYTKADFVARANAICASSLREARSIPSGSGPTTYLAAELPILEAEADQLLKLRRPPGPAKDQAILSRYFHALDQTVQAYRQLDIAVRHGDQQTVADAEAALADSPLPSLATSYGLQSCGAPGATVA
jgi:hypothetical protein